MGVSKEEAKQLRGIHDYLEEQYRLRIDVNLVGVYDKVVDTLTALANKGEDIGTNAVQRASDSYKVYKPERKWEFTEQEILDTAMRELTRFCFYELGERDCRRIGDRIYRELEIDAYFAKTRRDDQSRNGIGRVHHPLSEEEARKNDFICAINALASRVTRHWGTSLEAVA